MVKDMAHLIDKDALVAEIEKRIKCITKEYQESQQPEFFLLGKINGLENILPFLNTLEVKEVDLEKEINQWQGYEAFPEGVGIAPLPKAMEIVERTAKHFFELGLKVQKGE